MNEIIENEVQNEQINEQINEHNVYLFITKQNTVEAYADKEEAQRLFGYGEPDMVVTEEEFYAADNQVRLIDGKIFLGKTDEEKLEEKAREVREVRDRYLKQTDVYMLADFPITTEQKVLMIEYRDDLRNIPQQAGFPDVEVPKPPVFS